MREDTRDALVSQLSDHEHAVEIAIGQQTAVACELVNRGVTVVATDIIECPVPDGVTFVRDDVTSPDLAVYRDAGLLYALNLPPELHRPAYRLAISVDADFRFTTLGGDPPMISVQPVSIPCDTLYVAR